MAGEIVEICPVHHGVQGQRKTDVCNHLGHMHLAVETALVTADPVRHCGGDTLQGQLHMIQTGLIQRLQAAFRQPDARGDQIGIKPRLARSDDKIDKITARGGLAP